MQNISKTLLYTIMFIMLSGCPGEKKETKAKEKSDHALRSQFDALEKAKNVEKKLQDAYKEKFKILEKNEQQ